MAGVNIVNKRLPVSGGNGKMKKLFVGLMIAAIAAVIFGIFREEVIEVLRNGATLCFSCIGIQ